MEDTEKKTGGAESASGGAKGKKVKITLPRARSGEDKEVFVGVNGVNYLIPRGKEVEVPDYVAEEIRRAEAAEAYMDDEKDRLRAKGQ